MQPLWTRYSTAELDSRFVALPSAGQAHPLGCRRGLGLRPNALGLRRTATESSDYIPVLLATLEFICDLDSLTPFPSANRPIIQSGLPSGQYKQVVAAIEVQLTSRDEFGKLFRVHASSNGVNSLI